MIKTMIFTCGITIVALFSHSIVALVTFIIAFITAEIVIGYLD